MSIEVHWIGSNLRKGTILEIVIFYLTYFFLNSDSPDLSVGGGLANTVPIGNCSSPPYIGGGGGVGLYLEVLVSSSLL